MQRFDVLCQAMIRMDATELQIRGGTSSREKVYSGTPRSPDQFSINLTIFLDLLFINTTGVQEDIPPNTYFAYGDNISSVTSLRSGANG